MVDIRIAFITGMVVAFVAIVNQLTNSEILLAVTGWMSHLGG